MATRGVWQLQKLTVRYCQHGGSSRYIRDFIKAPDFHDFVRDCPQVEFHSELKNGRHPVLIGEYIDGNNKVVDIKNKEFDDILAHMQRLRNTSGRKMTKFKKPVVSENQSIQGIWQVGMEFPDFKIEHKY